MSAPTINQIASSYEISRQWVHKLRRDENLSPADFADPDLVLQRLLDKGNRSPLRSRLVNPTIRENIRHELDIAAIRGNAQTVQDKISSIQ